MNLLEKMENPQNRLFDVHQDWQPLCRSKVTKIKNLAQLWNAVCFLTVAEQTRIVHELRSASMTITAVRAAKGGNQRLLWQFAARDAKKWADSAKLAEPRYSQVADVIVQRADVVLNVSIWLDTTQTLDPYRLPMTETPTIGPHSGGLFYHVPQPEFLVQKLSGFQPRVRGIPGS